MKKCCLGCMILAAVLLFCLAVPAVAEGDRSSAPAVDEFGVVPAERTKPLTRDMFFPDAPNFKGSVGALTYNAHDYNLIRNFLELTDSLGVKNGDKLFAAYDPNDPMTWDTILWSEDGYLQTVAIRTSVENQHNVDETEGTVGELDLSSCEKLETVDVVCTAMTGIDVSNCDNLIFLSVFYGDLRYANMEGCSKLMFIWLVYNAKLTELDLSDATRLSQLLLSGCGLTNLDLSNNTMLTILQCDNNSLTELDVSMLTNLQELQCMNVDWEMPNYNRFTALDFTNNKQLRLATCYNTGVEELLVNNLEYLSILNAHNCNLESIDLSGCPNIQVLSLASNNISVLDTSGISQIFTIDISNTLLSQEAFEAAVYSHPEIMNLHIEGLGLTSFDCSIFQSLLELNLGSNDFTELEVSAGAVQASNLPNIEKLIIHSNVEYSYVIMDGSCPKELVIDAVSLGHFSCVGSGLSDISQVIDENPSINALYCSDNALTGTLDLSNLANLTALYCSDNAISSIVLAEGADLRNFDCTGTLMESFSVFTTEHGAQVDLVSDGNGYVGMDIARTMEWITSPDGSLTPFNYASITLWAAPKDGYEFKGWYDTSGELASEDANYVLSHGVEYSLTAAFEKAAETPPVAPPATGGISFMIVGVAAVNLGIGMAMTRKKNR